jgi:hypothetical protein
MVLPRVSAQLLRGPLLGTCLPGARLFGTCLLGARLFGGPLLGTRLFGRCLLGARLFGGPLLLGELLGGPLWYLVRCSGHRVEVNLNRLRSGGFLRIVTGVSLRFIPDRTAWPAACQPSEACRTNIGWSIVVVSNTSMVRRGRPMRGRPETRQPWRHLVFFARPDWG